MFKSIADGGIWGMKLIISTTINFTSVYLYLLCEMEIKSVVRHGVAGEAIGHLSFLSVPLHLSDSDSQRFVFQSQIENQI